METDRKMEEADIRQWIIDKITYEVSHNKEGLEYRNPIVGFSDARDPMYTELDRYIGHRQIRPWEILAKAQTVVAYFLPLGQKAVGAIQSGCIVSQNWSDYYTAANRLLKRLTDQMVTELRERGIPSAGIPPTNDFDMPTLTAQWSHKSAAVIAGIGTFGLNHLLVTDQGTMGRLGCFITAAKIEPTKREKGEQCLYYKNGTCKICVQKCPSGALSEEGFDRFRCNAYLDGKNIHDWQQGCGRCSSGPCALKGFAD